MAPPLPEAATGPRLQNRHEEEEDAGGGADDPPQSLAHPGPLGQGDETSGDDVEQDATRGAEQHGESRREDAPERLAEDPDDQPPSDAPQSGQPRPPTAGGDEEEDPDAQLDPHGGGGGCRRVTGPYLDAETDQALHPFRGGRRTGAQDAGRHSERHGLLQLQEAVDHPQGPEADPQHSTRHGLGRGGGPGRGELRSSRHGPAVLQGPQSVPGHEQEDQHQENQGGLPPEGRMELVDDGRVAGARRMAHSGHQASAFPEPVVARMGRDATAGRPGAGSTPPLEVAKGQT